MWYVDLKSLDLFVALQPFVVPLMLCHLYRLCLFFSSQVLFHPKDT